MTTLRQQLTRLFYRVGKPGVSKYLQELDALQWLSAAETLTLQRKYLLDTLEYANTHVPYYRDLFKKVGFQPADFAADPAALEKIPPLTKLLIRQNRKRLITTEPSLRKNLYQIKTGGTTGEPLWFTKDTLYRDYNIAHDYHVMTWAGWQMGQPQFWLWGHVPDDTAAGPSLTARLKDWLVNRFDADAFIMSPESLDAFAAVLEKHPGGILWSYVSTAYRFAQFLQERGHHIKLQAVYTAAEPLFEHQREFIQQVLHCPVFNNYSSIDTGDIAAECEQHNGLHILARNCYVEVLRNGQAVPDGEEGEFVLTTLSNYGAPLIRYQIEDWGKKSVRQCSCGRGLPMLEVVEGRKIDLFKTRSGRSVYGAYAKDLVPTLGDVKQFQVIQKSLDLVVFRIVHKGQLNRERLQKIERVSKMALGENVSVEFDFVDSLPVTPTGKHRYLVSEVH